MSTIPLRCSLLSFTILVLIGGALLRAADIPPKLPELLEQIRTAHNKIQNVQAQITCEIPDEQVTFYKNVNWGYDHGKEYVEGAHIFRESDTSRDYWLCDFKFAFDGNRMCLFRRDHRQPKVPTGRITSLEADVFRCFLTPNALLGYDIRNDGRHSVIDALAKAESLTVQPDLETVNGRACYVLEAIAVDRETDPKDPIYDVRLYLDPERDYRVIRLDKFFSFPGPQRFKALVRRMDVLALEKIGDVWFPVKGEVQCYSPQTELLPGVKPEDIANLPPQEAIQKKTITIKFLQPKNVLTIDPASVRINQPIPDEKFTVQFPHGCLMFDEFLQEGYTVGETPRHLTTPLPLNPLPGASSTKPTILAADDPAPSHQPSIARNSAEQHNRPRLWPYAVGIVVLVLVAIAWTIMFSRRRLAGSDHLAPK